MLSLHRSTFALLVSSSLLTVACTDDAGTTDTNTEDETATETADTESSSDDDVGDTTTTETDTTETDTTETDTTETDTTESSETMDGTMDETMDGTMDETTMDGTMEETTMGTMEETTMGEETGNGEPCEGGCGTLNCGACPEGPDPVDAGLFTIDSTEISNGQYGAFLDVEFDPAYLADTLPESCSWKSDFEPDEWPINPVANVPVTGVDWCDAYAYCAWSGKELCGEIGGGMAEIGDVQNASNNQWYRACTGGGITNYPYGLLYEDTVCNGSDAGFGQLVDVGSLFTCEGGFDGLFDMSGNAWEWTNACDEDPELGVEEQECRRRGGSFYSSGPNLRCGINSLRARNYRNDNTGFRCCDSE